MPPVGPKVSAFSVISERTTGRDQSPSQVQRPHHRSRIFRFLESSSGSIGAGDEMRGAVGQHERHGLARLDLEIGDRGQILAADLRRRAQHRHVLAGDRQQANGRCAAPTECRRRSRSG